MRILTSEFCTTKAYKRLAVARLGFAQVRVPRGVPNLFYVALESINRHSLISLTYRLYVVYILTLRHKGTRKTSWKWKVLDSQTLIFELCLKTERQKYFTKFFSKWLLGKIHLVKKIINRCSRTSAMIVVSFVDRIVKKLLEPILQLCLVSSNIQRAQSVNLVITQTQNKLRPSRITAGTRVPHVILVGDTEPWTINQLDRIPSQ
jgi:hypothetical protein